jgi:hypothetical protein
MRSSFVSVSQHFVIDSLLIVAQLKNVDLVLQAELTQLLTPGTIRMLALFLPARYM